MSRQIPAPAAIEDLMTATGLTKRQALREVRHGRLPGRMVGRRYVCPAGEFDAYLEGRWAPTPVAAADAAGADDEDSANRDVAPITPIEPERFIRRRSA